MASTDHPSVIAPPPLLYLLAVVLTATLHWYWPIELLPTAVATWLAILFAGIGLVLIAWGVYTMRQARTAINPYQPTSNIVDSGPFRFSRNPLYVGMDLVVIGIAAWINTLWGLPVIALVLVTMHYGVIQREERHLGDEFGEEYRAYRRKVRRYL